MEKRGVKTHVAVEAGAAISAERWPDLSDWREGLPVLCGAHVTLRELRLSDAPTLLAMLNAEEVLRFASPAPVTVEAFEQFILWTERQRAEGTYVCFGIVPAGYDVPVGIIQVRQTEPEFETAEWGVAIGSAFWGTGLFEESSRLVADFVFDTLGAHRLEARAVIANGRANGALRKLGAVQEGLLRKSFLRHGQYHDQILWTIVDEDWRLARTGTRPRVH